MPDRHFELPAHPDLEYYRKQAKQLLRSYEAGDPAARDRAAEVLGDRAAERFLLSDAQFVLAQEHGFRTWAGFRADIQSQRATGDRPVSRLWGRGGRRLCLVGRFPAHRAAPRRPGRAATAAGLCAQVRRCHRCLHRRAARHAADRRPGTRLPDLAGARGGRREIPAGRRGTPGDVAAHASGGRSPAGRRHRPAGPADRRAGRRPAADARHAGAPRYQARRADHPGRRRLDDRKVLCGILFVLYTGIPWEFLPQELRFGSGMTCWRRLRDWHQAGVFQQLHEALLAELNAAGALDWSRAVIDSSHVRAVKGGPKRARARSTAQAGLQAPPDHRGARDPRWRYR